MTWTRHQALPLIASAMLAIALGFGLTVNEQLSFVALVLIVGVAASAAPTSSWVAAALIAALTFRGLVQLGVLPSVATLLDMPLAWGALVVAAIKRSPDRGAATVLLGWLGALGVAILLAWAFHPSEALRPLLYLALLGEPFAIVGALCLDPPSPRGRRTLEHLVFLLLLIQIPIAAFQFLTLGPSDHVQGTLYGAGAGAHVISAVCFVGGIWILSRRGAGSLGRPWRLAAAFSLFVIPFIADAKQVIFAVPAILLASSWRDGFARILLRVVLVAASVVALITLQPAADTALGFLERAQAGRSGKAEAAAFVWDRMKDDPASVAFGLGPAETVSRAAFMTTDSVLGTDSPIRTLGLQPAAVATEAQAASFAASHGGTSFNSGLSSALGVFGDLGVIGLSAYIGTLAWLILLLRRQHSAEATVAAAGFAMFAVLGLIFDWWEQPPFSVTLAILAGLALTRTSGREGGHPPTA